MILCYSGTGNSLRLARQLASELEDELFFLNPVLRTGKVLSFSSGKPYVLVSPTYAWRLPRVVEEALLRARFEGSRRFYVVLTCGSGVGAAPLYAERLAQSLGLDYRGLAPVVMPENYIALFRAPGPQKTKRLLEAADGEVLRLADSIRQDRAFREAELSRMSQRLSDVLYSFFYRHVLHDKRFYVKKNCISCGRCEKLCPLGNIRLVEGRPKWQGNCTHCMACISACPTEAIEYSFWTWGKRRYYLEDAFRSLEDEGRGG